MLELGGVLGGAAWLGEPEVTLWSVNKWQRWNQNPNRPTPGPMFKSSRKNFPTSKLVRNYKCLPMDLPPETLEKANNFPGMI